MYEMMDQHRVLIPGCLDNFPILQNFMERFEVSQLPDYKLYTVAPGSNDSSHTRPADPGLPVPLII